MFQEYYRDRAPEYLGKEFGPRFAMAITQVAPGQWTGPLESGFGWHLVYVDTVIPGRVPDFEEVEAEVKVAWLGEQKAGGAARSRHRGDDAMSRSFFARSAEIVALALFVFANAAGAHESRPAYLEVTETAPDQYQLMWRTPVLAGMRLPVRLRLPAGLDADELHVQRLADSVVERRSIDARGTGLGGQRIEFPGLQLTITDVLVRVQRLDGTHSTELVRPSQPWFEFSATAAPQRPIAFVRHGIGHIVTGIDHLLFVFGLLLLVRSPWMLIKTITAFTLAHSITLALATLGYVDVPGPPLEASIALSILFLGVEVVRAWNGGTSFTIRNPWVVAFAFGLLHGFGFAGGLAAIGLPAGEVPLALLWFNVGVELGQLAFVGGVLLLLRSLRALRSDLPARAALAPAYVIGTAGAFWTIERVVMMAGVAQ